MTVKQSKYQLSAQDSIQIAFDAHNRNGKKNERYPDQNAYKAVNQAESGFAQTIENTGKCGVQIKKRTDKGHSTDINTCGVTVKKKFSEKLAEKNKQGTAKTSKKQTVSENL